MSDERERNAQRRAQAIFNQIQQHQGVLNGVELMRFGVDGPWQGAVILPSAKRVGWWQLTYFDAKGFMGDSQWPSALDAIEEAVAQGYTVWRRGLLHDAFQLSSFRIGVSRNDFLSLSVGVSS